MAPRFDLALTWRDGREETVRATAPAPASSGDEPAPASGGETSRAAGNETVLEAAESAGVAIPFGCRTGACGTCTGRVVEGDVSHRRPPRALKPGHLRDGYVLCCIATPETDCRIEVGAAVRDDLLANPFE